MISLCIAEMLATYYMPHLRSLDRRRNMCIAHLQQLRVGVNIPRYDNKYLIPQTISIATLLQN